MWKESRKQRWVLFWYSPGRKASIHVVRVVISFRRVEVRGKVFNQKSLIVPQRPCVLSGSIDKFPCSRQAKKSKDTLRLAVSDTAPLHPRALSAFFPFPTTHLDFFHSSIELSTKYSYVDTHVDSDATPCHAASSTTLPRPTHGDAGTRPRWTSSRECLPSTSFFSQTCETHFLQAPEPGCLLLRIC